MNPPDLTPSPYRNRARTRAATRHWSLAAGACLVLAAGAVLIPSARPPDASASRAQERLALANSRLQHSRGATQTLTQQLAQYERELQAEQHLTQRPDWSAVLTLVARQFDRDSVMTGFELGQADQTPVRSALGPLAAEVPQDSVWLIITGVADANSTVPGLILSLERLGLFHRVIMTGTQRQSFAGGPRTGFTLACRVH